MPRTRRTRPRKYGGRRARRGRGQEGFSAVLKYGLLAGASVAALGTGAYTLDRAADVETLSENYCLVRENQPVVAIQLDNSFTGQLGGAQERDYETAFLREWENASPNTRIEVFTTARGDAGSVARPVVSICKPAGTPQQLEALGAPRQNKQRAAAILEEAGNDYGHAIEQVLAIAKDEARAASISPILETVSAVSRYRGFTGKQRRFVLFSDGIQNSELARFCAVQGDMPSYQRFDAKAEFQAFRPRSFEGAEVEMYLVEYGRLPTDELKYCTTAEMRRWWGDLFRENGAADVQITPVSYWGD